MTIGEPAAIVTHQAWASRARDVVEILAGRRGTVLSRRSNRSAGLFNHPGSSRPARRQAKSGPYCALGRCAPPKPLPAVCSRGRVLHSVYGAGTVFQLAGSSRCAVQDEPALPRMRTSSLSRGGTAAGFPCSQLKDSLRFLSLEPLVRNGSPHDVLRTRFPGQAPEPAIFQPGVSC